MSRKLEDLDPRFESLARKLLDECRAAGVPLFVVDTRRTIEEHKANLTKGVSWVRRSKHVDGLAIDVCPEVLLMEKGWAPQSPLWKEIGRIGKSLGLRWGGDWRKKDLGHFEFVERKSL